MQVTLYKGTEKEKTYKTGFIKSRMVRKALELSEKNGGLAKINTGILDKLVDFCVEVYGKQFTEEDIYEGLESHKLYPTLLKCITDIASDLEEKAEEMPKN